MFDKLLGLIFENNEIKNAKLVVAKNPENITARIILADLYSGKKLFKDAILHLEFVRKINPNHLVMLEKLSECYIKDSEFEKARDILYSILELSHNDELAIKKLVMIIETSVDVELNIEILERLVEINSNDTISRERFAILLNKNGQFTKSLQQYEILIKAIEDPRYLKTMSVLYEKTGQIPKAIRTLEFLFMKKQISTQELKKLGIFYSDNGKHAEAIEIFKLLMDLLPEEEKELRNLLALALVKQGSYEDAILMCKSLILANPDYSDYKFTLVKALDGKKDYVFGIEFLKEFLTDPINKKTEAKVRKELSSFMLKLALQTKNSDVKKALDIIQDSFAYDDKNPNAYFVFGLINFEIKNFDEAIAKIKQAIALDDKNPEYHFCLANVYKLVGNFQLAVISLDRAIELNPAYANK